MTLYPHFWLEELAELKALARIRNTSGRTQMERGTYIRHTDFTLIYERFEEPVEHLKQGVQRTCTWVCKSEHQEEDKAAEDTEPFFFSSVERG